MKKGLIWLTLMLLIPLLPGRAEHAGKMRMIHPSPCREEA